MRVLGMRKVEKVSDVVNGLDKEELLEDIEYVEEMLKELE